MAPRSEGSAAPTAPAPVRVARSDDLQGDGPHAVSAGDTDLVVVRTKAGLRAFEGRCPHQGAILGEGELDGDTLVCRNHRWRFNVEDGRRVGGPQRLASCPVVEQAGAVLVDTSRLQRGAGQRASGLRTVDALPGPIGLPLLGNMHQIQLSALHLILEGWATRYGPIYRYRLGPQRVVAVSNPELSQQVLRARPETFRRLSNVEPVFVEMGAAGVFSAEGPAWRPQRRLAMEALSHRHLHGFYPTLRSVAERLKRRWDAAADRGTPIDIVDDLKRFTVDVTTLVTFGHDVNSIEQGEDVLQRRLELVFPAMNRRLFALFPTWRFVRLPRDRQLDRALAWIRSWLRELVAAARVRITAAESRPERPSNFLDAMLSARDEAGQPFPDETIFGNLMTMLLAGEDTTAYTLAWAVHHLCDSPAAVDALRREVDARVGAAAVPAELETTNQLSWAGAIADEAMRLRPVAPLNFNESNEETVLGDVLLPPRTQVVVLTRPVAHAAEHFVDPTSFRPERWLGDASGAHEPATLMPFGSGPRVCPGRTLALLEMKVVLAMLYKNFSLERVGKADDVREVFAFVMSPHGLRVRLRRREA